MPSLFASSGQTPVTADDVMRKKQLAEMLMKQAATPNQQAMDSNSPLLAALVPLMGAFAAKRAQGKATEAERGLMGQRQAELSKIMAAGQGTPDQTVQTPFVDDQAQFMGQESPAGLVESEQTIPGKPGGRDAMIQAMLASSMPDIQQLGLKGSLEKPQAQWEQVPGPRGSILQRNTVTGEMKSVVGQEPSDILMAGLFGPKLSPTAQKELFEADETAQATANVKTLLDEALSINDKAYSGPAAKERAIGMSWLPGDNEAADATVNLDNIMTGQALESLKAVFGGMPTEGERKILLEMQASPSKTPKQRAEIINRAKAAADRRMKFNQEKAQSLRGGKYFKEAPTIQAPAPTSIDDLLKKY